MRHMMVAAPRTQYKHKYIDRSIRAWLDVHYGDASFNGRVLIGHRKSGGGVYTMTARSMSEIRPYVLMVHASKKLDYYITANSVSGTTRTKAGLFGLQNIVVDIDCHEKDVDPRWAVESFIWNAQQDLWQDEALPMPNSIVRTGRGVQLWWAIEPCHASCQFHYDQIKAGILDQLELFLDEYPQWKLSVDRGASMNPVGYFRLPGTYNTVAKCWGSFQVLRTERYNTHEMAEYIQPLSPDKRPSRGFQRPSKQIPLQECDIIVLHNNYSTGATRVLQLIKLRNLRDNQVGAETRNNLCFSVYNALRMSYGHDDAMERLRAYNEGFKKPMTERELERTLSSAIRKEGYKYTNAKLIELLDITEAEQDIIGLHAFNGAYRPWSHAKPNATRDAVRKARKDDRNDKIIALFQAGVSQSETARRLGIGRSTVIRVLKDWQAQLAEKEAQEKLCQDGSINDCLIVRDSPSYVDSVFHELASSSEGFVVLPFRGRSDPKPGPS